jgi:hypothetical protein
MNVQESELLCDHIIGTEMCVDSCSLPLLHEMENAMKCKGWIKSTGNIVMKDDGVHCCLLSAGGR